MPIDYSALTLPVTKEDLRAYSAKYESGALSFGAATAIGAICLVLIVGITVSVSGIGHGAVIPMMVFLGLPAVLIGWLAIVLSRKAKKMRARLYKFALANKSELIINRSARQYAGMLFDEGHSQTIKEALVLADGREIGNYTYVTGSGKNRREHYWGYARVKLSRRLPHMVLDAKSNNFLKRFSNLPDGFIRNQTLRLEGNFNDHFTLYAPKEYEQDAFYVFTPDVMAAILDSGIKYDIEVVDDTLILYSSSEFRMDQESQLRSIMQVIDTISDELKDQSSYYADERVGDRALNIVAPAGHRLKAGVRIGTIITIILFVAYAVWTLIEIFRSQ